VIAISQDLGELIFLRIIDFEAIFQDLETSFQDLEIMFQDLEMFDRC
jgi:hypothetical protein